MGRNDVIFEFKRAGESVSMTWGDLLKVYRGDEEQAQDKLFRLITLPPGQINKFAQKHGTHLIA